MSKYDEVLKPFVQLMEKELHANAGKGDRPGWLAMSADTCLLEIIYHFGKLQASVKRGDIEGITEYAADVANMSMMLVDICGALPAQENHISDRDQLRAEVAGLRTGYEAYEQVNAELKAEVEKLRKERDARHPFKPFHEPSIGYTGCVICGVYTDHGGLPCPKTRALANALAMENQRITPVEPLRVPHPLDAALGQGEQS